MNMERGRPSYYDVNYALASAKMTNGNVLVTSTAAAYHGFALLTTSAGATVRIYDSSSATATGNLLDILFVAANVSTRRDVFIPIQAKVGIVASLTLATAAEGVVFYGPKG